MGAAIKMTEAYLDSKNFRYSEVKDGTALKLGIGGLDNKGRMDIIVFFDDDDGAVALRSFDLCTFGPNRREKMYEVCSDLNARFRWVKFFVDEQDNTLTVADDGVVQLDTVGAEVFELVMRMASIVDEGYPEIMKAIWG